MIPFLSRAGLDNIFNGEAAVTITIPSRSGTRAEYLPGHQGIHGQELKLGNGFGNNTEVRNDGPPECELELWNGELQPAVRRHLQKAHYRQRSHRSCICTASGANTRQPQLTRAMSEGCSVPTHGTDYMERTGKW